MEEEELTNISKESSLSATEKIISITRTIEAMRKSWFSLYDRYSEGEINREQYIQQKKEYDEQIKKMETELMFLQQEKAQGEDSEDMDAINMAKSYLESEELTEEMKETLIDKVIIFPENRMEIVWAYKEA